VVIAFVRAFARARAGRKEDRMTQQIPFATADAPCRIARVRTDASMPFGRACEGRLSSHAFALRADAACIGKANTRRRVFIAGGDP